MISNAAIRAEARWFIANYLLLNAVAFAFFVVLGIVVQASFGGTIPGYGGSPIEQIFWHAVGGLFLLTLPLGIPALAVTLTAWRLATRLVGHSRLTAYLVGTLVVLIAAYLIERTEPLYLAIVLVAVLGYATIVRLPPGHGPAVRPAVPSDQRS